MVYRQGLLVGRLGSTRQSLGHSLLNVSPICTYTTSKAACHSRPLKIFQFLQPSRSKHFTNLIIHLFPSFSRTLYPHFGTSYPLNGLLSIRIIVTGSASLVLANGVSRIAVGASHTKVVHATRSPRNLIQSMAPFCLLLWTGLIHAFDITLLLCRLPRFCRRFQRSRPHHGAWQSSHGLLVRLTNGLGARSGPRRRGKRLGQGGLETDTRFPCMVVEVHYFVVQTLLHVCFSGKISLAITAYGLVDWI